MMRDASADRPQRFQWLGYALVVLLVSYPYFPESAIGALAGGVMALVVLVAALRATHRERHIFISRLALASTVLIVDIASYSWNRGHLFVELAFTLFYAWVTCAVVREVFRDTAVTFDTVRGAAAAYVLIGLAFGSLYDLIETVEPGSFQLNIDVPGAAAIGWRRLVFYSFMTLTTIGYGDLTPITTQAQSLAIIQGVIGVLFVAVIIGRTLGLVSQQSVRDPKD